jgi:pimeloyl-ACP methyl ester carboxylesterase
VTTVSAPPVELRRVPGEGTGRMLLLHGLANSSTVWQRYLDTGPLPHDVWLADLPWRGEGDPAWLRDREPTAGIAGALRGLDGPADVVVAHSFSANLLLALADADEDLLARHGVRALVLVSPFYRARPEDFTWASMSYYLNDFHRIMAEGIRVHAGERLAPDRRQAMAERVRDRVGPYGWTAFFSTYLRTPWLRLERIGVPALVLAGERDFAAPPAESAALSQGLPGAEFHLLGGCGHFLMSERPDAFSSAVHDFLGRLDRAGSATTPGTAPAPTPGALHR